VFNVVDFTKYRRHRQAATSAQSAFKECLFSETITDMLTIVDKLKAVESSVPLNLTELEREQLDFLTMLADELNDHWYRLDMDQVPLHDND
jgi:hypothetical protein